MSDEQLEDIKQYIDSRASQTENLLGQRIDGLEAKVDDGFSGVGEAITEINDKIDKRDEQVDSRLTKLEKQAA